MNLNTLPLHRILFAVIFLQTLLLAVHDSRAATSKKPRNNKSPAQTNGEQCTLRKDRNSAYVLVCKHGRRTVKANKQCSCPRGRRGQKGARGRQGPAGLTGPPGLAGTDGRDGRGGLRGRPGMTGIIGKPGAKGTVGPVGPQGPTGLAGRDGTPGPPGPPGTPGACIKQSVTSKTNIISQSCLPGAPGPRGEGGITGQTGPTGAEGPPGESGMDGKAGKKGSVGAQGPAGPPGKIAGLRCIVHFTVWFEESKWKSLTPEVGCNGSAFLQKFSLQRTSPNMRYKYTCCTFQ